MSKISNSWVFSDSENRLDELMGAALNLSENVNVIIIGSNDEVKKAFCLGANEVYFMEKNDEMIENYASSIAKAINDNTQNAIVLLPNTRRGKALASLIAVPLNAGVATEVNKVEIENGIKCSKMLYGGLATGVEVINSKIGVVVLNQGVFEPSVQNQNSEKEPKILEFVQPKNPIKCIKKLPKQASNIDLNKAKRIVAIGRGIAKEEDIVLAKELCEILGAELGCSRPIAEGEKWMEHERYIGISSVMPKPEIYVAVGISGQIQHMVGVKDAGKIIAINKDKNAPIFEYADYGIVGDLYKVLPKLTSALK